MKEGINFPPFFSIFILYNKIFYNMKNKLISVTKFVSKYVTIGCLVGIIASLTLVGLYEEHEVDYNSQIVRSRNELHYQGIKDRLVEATDKYIQTVGPGSCLNGLVLLEACDEYNVDLKFALAQGHIESHFGTKGIAAKTNSVFNVMSFDGLSAEQIIRSGKGYSHPDHSVAPYLKLLTEKYLQDKTEQDMFIKFENSLGQRYATDKNYEKKLLDTYEKIDSISEITTLYNEYKKYSIILQ